MSLRRVDRGGLPGLAEAETFADCQPELAFVAVNSRDGPMRPQAVALPCYEVVYVQAGRLTMWLADGPLDGLAGDVFVIPPRTTHREETPDGAISEVLCLGASFVRASGRHRSFPLPLAVHLHLGSAHPVPLMLRQIVAEVDHQVPGWSAVTGAKITEVFCALARATAGRPAPPWSPANPAVAPFAVQVEGYLRDHLAEPLSVDDIARHFHLSRQYFNRLFRRVTGDTPHAFLTATRLDHARDLLADASLPIKAVAQRVGYADPYHFSKAFKHRFQLSPTAYRQTLNPQSRTDEHR